MEERLVKLGTEPTVQAVVNKINKIVEEQFDILIGENDINKWNTVPLLLMMEESDQKIFLEFIDFMDSLLVPIEKKVLCVISLSGLIDICSLKLKEYDNGNLFLLADYYQNKSIEEIKKAFSIIGNKELLLAIRKKTLDLDSRKQLLDIVLGRLNNDKVAIKDTKKVNAFLEKTIAELETKEFYELINK